MCGVRGYDGGKKMSGRKRRLLGSSDLTATPWRSRQQSAADVDEAGAARKNNTRRMNTRSSGIHARPAQAGVVAAREGTAQPATAVGVHPPSNSCPAHAAEQGNLVRSRRPSPLAVYRRRCLVGPFPSPLAADRRVASRRRCRGREQALGAEVLEKSEAIDSVEAKVAALRDEVVELKAEQQSLHLRL